MHVVMNDHGLINITFKLLGSIAVDAICTSRSHRCHEVRIICYCCCICCMFAGNIDVCVDWIEMNQISCH